MSLRIWLPLTKDLRNQGLSSATIEEVTSAVFDNSGKLGKCLSEGKIKIPANQVASIFNNTSMSIAFWYNNNTSETTGNHAICGFSGNGEGDTDAVRIWDFFNYSNPNAFHWSMGTLGGGSLSNIFPANTWVHVCVTWNAPTLKIYMDGILKYTGSGSSNYTFDKSYYISFGRTPQKLNDFRLYNHCLSPMEVKQISQGLVLHYPLNRNGWGQENLIANTDFNGISKKFTVTSGTEGGFTFTPTETIVALTEYTVSCKLRGNANMNLYKLCTGGNESIQWVNRDQLSTTDYKLFSITFTYPSNKTLNQIYICTRYGTANTQVGDWFEIEPNSLKLEKGSIATPWCPNSSDILATTMGLNSTTEYDCSGFCNNGTRTGTFTWTSNTAKYAVSTKFNGTDNAIQTPSLPTMITDKNYTIAVWIYKTVIGSKGYQTIYGGPSGFEIEARNGSANETKFVPWNWGKPMASYELNEWNHCVFVHSDADCKIYLNGEYIATGTAKASNPTGNYFVGAWNTATQQNFDGLMSDFRIYATALSASDVKSLYQNSAYIDSSGNVYGAVHTEV